MRSRRDLEWNARRIHEHQRSDQIGAARCKVDRDMSTHRIADDMDRLVKFRLDPARQQRRQFIEGQRK